MAGTEVAESEVAGTEVAGTEVAARDEMIAVAGRDGNGGGE
jgi:hypothetical protein